MKVPEDAWFFVSVFDHAPFIEITINPKAKMSKTILDSSALVDELVRVIHQHLKEGDHHAISQD